MNCSVYLNGEHLLTHPYGYTSFAVDLTAGGLRLGQPNVLAIRAESRGSNSRWYISPYLPHLSPSLPISPSATFGLRP